MNNSLSDSGRKHKSRKRSKSRRRSKRSKHRSKSRRQSKSRIFKRRNKRPSRRRSKRNKKSYDEMSDLEFIYAQTCVGLKAYIKSKGLKGYSKLTKKDDIVKFILKNIDIETGKLLK